MTRQLSVHVVNWQIYMGKLWTNTSYKSFVTALTLCGFTSYMFGWHVHEKAILLVLVPLRYVIYLRLFLKRVTMCITSLLAAESNEYFRTFELASVAGIFSLFPLLFTPAGTFCHDGMIAMCSHLHRNIDQDRVFCSVGRLRLTAHPPSGLPVSLDFDFTSCASVVGLLMPSVDSPGRSHLWSLISWKGCTLPVSLSSRCLPRCSPS